MHNLSSTPPICLDGLSKREAEVARKIIQGLPNKVIASDLYISERTVKFHCANIYRKLNIRNRAALMAGYFHHVYASPVTLQAVM